MKLSTDQQRQRHGLTLEAAQIPNTSAVHPSLFYNNTINENLKDIAGKHWYYASTARNLFRKDLRTRTL